MDYKKIIDKLTKNSEFKKWKKDNPDTILAHLFMMNDAPNKDSWQIGYYNVKSNKITTFIIEKDDIKIIPEANIFKKDNDTIKELKIDKVKVTYEKAEELAQKLQKEKYSKEIPLKTIAILQHLDLGQVWNITFVTRSFNTLNIKIDSESGKVLKDGLVSFMEFQK